MEAIPALGILELVLISMCAVALLSLAALVIVVILLVRRSGRGASQEGDS